MAVDAPVLLLGFNRPDKMRQLIEALRTLAPQTVLLAVDGPRPRHPTDTRLVSEVRDCVNLINWTDRVHVRFRDSNLGLRTAVVEAVTWAISEHGRTIVLEDDCIPGRSLLRFLNKGLDEFAFDRGIGHINGYNLVPSSKMSSSENQIRFSRYIESYAWATWERSWKEYDDSLEWALNCSIEELAHVVDSRIAALRWKINFRDAASGRIDTWAYRWMATLWKKQMYAVAPPANLCSYDGHDLGTHTLRSPKWQELPVEEFDSEAVEDWFKNSATHDARADNWTGCEVFRETPSGLLEGLAASLAMEVHRHVRT